MVHDRKRPVSRPASPARPVTIIAGLNLGSVIAASAQTDPLAWWTVAGIFAVSAICVTVLLITCRPHRRR